MNFVKAQRLSSALPSPTLALNAKAKAMVGQGLDVVSFAAGEPDFDTPSHVKRAMFDALDEGFTKYTATSGIPELKSAIVKKLEVDNGLSYRPDNVLVTVGGKQALFNAFEALLSPGDEVVIFSPYWVSYPEMVRLADGVVVVVPTRAEDHFVPRPEDLAKALTPKTKAVVFNSPSNPTGTVIPAAVLAQCAEVLRAHSCFVITDDIYEKLIYLPGRFENIVNAAPFLKERAIVVNGFSKAYAMTGLRLGYAVGPSSVIAAMQLVQDQATSNATSIVQKAGVAALIGTQTPLKEMHTEYSKRRVRMADGLNSIAGIECAQPDGAFYCLANVKAVLAKRFEGRPIETAERLSELLLEKALVAAVPGGAFGAPGYIRFSFATSNAGIETGLQRVRQFVEGL
jgi:aspartate aminotransferase